MYHVLPCELIKTNTWENGTPGEILDRKWISSLGFLVYRELDILSSTYAAPCLEPLNLLNYIAPL